MGFVLVAFVLCLVAVLADCGPVYPFLWHVGVEPALYFRALFWCAAGFFVFGVVYDQVRWSRR